MILRSTINEMVFCCIVAWIQPDISGCQQDFLEQFLRISRGWQPLENCSRIYPKMSSTNFIFKQQKIEFLNQVWSCYYATGCFVAFLGDISSWGPLLVWVQFSLDYRTHAIITRGLYTFYHWLWTPREDSLPCTAEKIQSQSQIFRYGQSIFCLPHRPIFSDFIALWLHWVSSDQVHFRKNWSYLFISGLPVPIFGL